MKKTCTKCGRKRAAAEFKIYASGPRIGKFHCWCQECYRESSKLANEKWNSVPGNLEKKKEREQQRRIENPAHQIARNREYRKNNREKVRASERSRHADMRRKLDLLKMGRPCYDCGGDFPPVCLSWDHIPGKEKFFTIGSQMKSHCLDAVIDEINKCQLVCFNCHQLRTANRKLKGEVT